MTQKKEITVDLPGVDRPARVVMQRSGQMPPYVSNNVRVMYDLWLPADPMEQNYLDPEICFGGKVKLLDGYLNYWWPREYNYEKQEVGRSNYIDAPTWAAAFRMAEDYVLRELRKLVEALKARQQALIEAEYEEKEN